MRFEHSIRVAASPAALWAVLSDVTSWPQFVPTVTSVEPLEPGPLRVGARYRLRQPRLPENDWTVTELVERERFTWEATSPGLRIVAVHEISPQASGSAELRLEVDQRGWLAPVGGLLTARLTRRYLGLEAEAMKQRAEARP